jgi:hypothetical protein
MEIARVQLLNLITKYNNLGCYINLQLNYIVFEARKQTQRYKQIIEALGNANLIYELKNFKVYCTVATKNVKIYRIKIYLDEWLSDYNKYVVAKLISSRVRSLEMADQWYFKPLEDNDGTILKKLDDYYID